ncbi:glutathione reductase (plasmid) [Carnobacterium maltaromaticum]|uniref:glutathione reductase n=1 Tax=Carnobacterium maltaromaticum TaxID=2751 RepID=UPI00344BB24E
MNISEVEGFSNLDSYQKNKLSIVYAQHMYQLGEPNLYNENNIIEVTWDNDVHDIVIHFKNNDSYHYTMDGTWYLLDTNGKKIILDKIEN